MFREDDVSSKLLSDCERKAFKDKDIEEVGIEACHHWCQLQQIELSMIITCVVPEEIDGAFVSGVEHEWSIGL